MAKRESRVSPLGEAKWAHVHTPKDAFEGEGEGKFQIDVVFEPGGEWDALGNEIEAAYKKNPKYKHKPLKKEMDQNDEHTGRYYITFKTGAQYPPKVFDKYGKDIPSDVNVGNGSTVRVNYTMDHYDHRGNKGITFYFNAIQVTDLVEYKGKNADDYGFEVEEGVADVFGGPDDRPDDPPFDDGNVPPEEYDEPDYNPSGEKTPFD
jgi:hypothetical protein